MTFVVIMIGVWIGIMVIWYVVSAAFKSADIDRIKRMWLRERSSSVY